jgi:hypothetical protein
MKITDPSLSRNQKSSTPGSARPGLNPNQIPLIDTPRARNRWDKQDPPTSRLAAESVTPAKLSATQEWIIRALEASPKSDEELCFWIRERHRVSPQSIRSRRSELVRKGLVEDTGRRKPTQYGRESIVWRLA